MNAPLRRFLALLLCLLVAVKTLLVPVVYMDFSLHRDEIVSRLCENRLRPALHCNGQCQLAKRLGQLAEKHARDTAGRHADFLKHLLEEVFDAAPLRFVFEPPFAERPAIAAYAWLAGVSRLYSGSTFHPPTP